MPREGDHRMRMTVTGNSRSASKELRALAKQQHSMEQQLVRTNERLAKHTKVTRQSSKATKASAENLGRQVDKLKGYGVAVAGAALTVDQLAQRQLALQNVQANLPFSINEARQATRGMVDDLTLMKLAVNANQLGVAKSSVAFAALAGNTSTLALKLGRDVPDALRRATLGIGKMETEMLDELGIVGRAEDAWKTYAQSIGKTTAELTEQEKRTAFTTVKLQQIADAARGAAVATDSLGASWVRLKATGLNLLDTLLNVEENTESLGTEVLRDVLGVSTDEARAKFQELSTVAKTGARVGLGAFTLGASEAGFALVGLATDTDDATRAQRDFQAEVKESTFALEGQKLAIQDFENRKKKERALAEARDLESESRHRKDEKKRQAIRQQIAIANAQEHLAEVRRNQRAVQALAGQGANVAHFQIDLVEQVRAAEIRLLQAQRSATRERADLIRNTTAQRDASHSSMMAQAQLEHEAAQRAKRDLEASLEIVHERASFELQQQTEKARRRRELEEFFAGNRLEAVEAGGGFHEGERLAAMERINEAREREVQAQRDSLQFQAAEARARGEELEAKRFEAQERDLLHQSELQRMQDLESLKREHAAAAQERLEQQRQRTRMVIGLAVQEAAGVGNALVGMRFSQEAAARAAREAGESESKARRRATGQAMLSISQQLAGQSISHAAQATAAFLTFNPVMGAAHAGAAGVLAVASAALAARGNSILGEVGGGAGGSGGGAAANNAPTARSGDAPEVPASPPPGSAGNETPDIAPVRSGTANSRVYHINLQSLAPTKETGREIRQILEDLEAAEG